MIKQNKIKVAACALALSLCAPLAAVPGPKIVPIPVPVPVPEPAPAPRRAPPPPPAPRRVEPARRHIRVEGRLKIRRYHGKDTIFLETRDGDFFLYPDDFDRNPLTWDDFEFYEDEFVEVEGYIGPARDEITVQEIHRVHRSHKVR